MVLFLSGGGSGEKSKEIDMAFVQVVGKDKPILYIPLARDPPYDACLDWILDNFAPFNFNNIKIAFTHYLDKAKKLAETKRYNYVFYGHTHKPWEEEINSTKIINPGTLAGVWNRSTFAILDTKIKKVELIIL